ncbi:isocitrate lyase/PEP mutase family protein [Cyanobium sp. ATX 6A2]|uniref:isocitrate lyase/PEP mutase family protein n=1 Tax=Cyanobium sp. ATX 6A2 TaxID=2823700 RepID=UPI0020CD59EA|nr:isocitrate lyase/PEP mutase family protein [Cyanobium sp. ATX 6A2]MCP9888744.1 isocitrate lyase/PEP mutase family protein [Cyanobium sp. ATX 6A2]
MVRPVPFIGIYDLFSARLAASRFDTLFVSGFGLAASTYGLPDVGFMAWSDLLTFVHRLRHAFPHHHLLVDLDDGFGDATMAAHVAHAVERAGASGIVLEDQRRPRRCGHLHGKEILPLEEYLLKLRAVLDARDSLVVVARTDATDPEEILRRVRAFEAEGCDAVLADGLDDLDLLAAIRSSVRCSVVANVIGGGRTPPCDRETLGRLGLNLLLYSTPCLFAAQRAIEQQLMSLTEEQLPFSDSLRHGVSLSECQEVLKDSLWP